MILSPATLVNHWSVEGIPRNRNPLSNQAPAPGGTVPSTYRQHGNVKSLVRFPIAVPTMSAGSIDKSNSLWRQPISSALDDVSRPLASGFGAQHQICRDREELGSVAATGDPSGPWISGFGAQHQVIRTCGEPDSRKKSAAVQRNFARFDERNTVDHENFGSEAGFTNNSAIGTTRDELLR